jgi:hypothetical protein
MGPCGPEARLSLVIGGAPATRPRKVLPASREGCVHQFALSELIEQVGAVAAVHLVGTACRATGLPPAAVPTQEASMH